MVMMATLPDIYLAVIFLEISCLPVSISFKFCKIWSSNNFFFALNNLHHLHLYFLLAHIKKFNISRRQVQSIFMSDMDDNIFDPLWIFFFLSHPKRQFFLSIKSKYKFLLFNQISHRFKWLSPKREQINIIFV